MDILKEFGLYDILGRLIPGIFVVWAVLAVIETKGAKKLWYRLRKQVFLLLVLSYLVGSMVHALGSWVYRPFHQCTAEKVLEDYPDQFEDQLITKAQTEFELSLDLKAKSIQESESAIENRKKLFDLCHTFCQAHEADDYLDIMQARFAFYRTLIVAMIIAAIAFGYRFVSHWCRQCERLQLCSSLCIFLAFLLGFAISARRAYEFNRYFADHTFRMFYLRYNDSAISDDASQKLTRTGLPQGSWTPGKGCMMPRFPEEDERCRNGECSVASSRLRR